MLLFVLLFVDGFLSVGYYVISSGVELLFFGFFEGFLMRFEDELEGFRSIFEYLYKDL